MQKLNREVRFIIKYLKIKKINNLDIDYLEKKYLDSLNLIKFISSIEKNFKIKFNQNDFLNRKFRTIKGLGSIINKKIK